MKSCLRMRELNYEEKKKKRHQAMECSIPYMTTLNCLVLAALYHFITNKCALQQLIIPAIGAMQTPSQ